LEIADTSNQIDNSVKNKKRKLNKLYRKLNHLYNEIDKRNNSSYRQKHSKNVLENITWDDERTLVTPKDKIETLQYIKQKALVIDSFVFTDENESSIKCLSVAL
jgi:nitrate/nitrite-specific signal transduction histidine kinase